MKTPTSVQPTKSVTATDPSRRWLPTVRLLTRCFQGFERISDLHVRTLGLTGPQFDIIATLGNTPGMTCRELGERTLITKGTLTGVLDRLVARGLVSRCSHETDGRSRNVRLTEAGRHLFEAVFSEHLAHCAEAFVALDDAALVSLNLGLGQMLKEFESFTEKRSHVRSAHTEKNGVLHE